MLVTGSVSTVDGRPLAGAVVDVWHSDDDGYYDVQQLDKIGDLAMRACFHTDQNGRFHFGRSSLPPIPFRMTVRSARCWRCRAVIPGVRRMCIS